MELRNVMCAAATGIMLSLMGCADGGDPVRLQKGVSTVMQGTLTTSGGHSPIGGMVIEIDWVLNPPGGEEILRRKVVCVTSSDGHFEVKFPVHDDEMLNGYFTPVFLTDSSQYLLRKSDLPKIYLKGDSVVTLDYLLPRKAFIQVEISNRQEVQPAQGDSYASTFDTYLGVNAQHRDREVVDWYHLPHGAVLEVAADQPVIVQSTKIRNGVTVSSSETLTLAPGENRIFTVEF